FCIKSAVRSKPRDAAPHHAVDPFKAAAEDDVAVRLHNDRVYGSADSQLRAEIFVGRTVAIKPAKVIWNQMSAGEKQSANEDFAIFLDGDGIYVALVGDHIWNEGWVQAAIGV